MILHRCALGLLLACGLRRAELATLDVKHIGQREGRWVVVDLEGKHGRIRTVPMPAWVKLWIDDWMAAAGISAGALLRAVSKGGLVQGQGLTPQAIYYVVAGYAAWLGVALTPHDLRRTFGKLAHHGGSPLEQIQLSYGHASLTTTERCLGVRQDFLDSPCDRLGLRSVSTGS
jgi:integrase